MQMMELTHQILTQKKAAQNQKVRYTTMLKGLFNGQQFIKGLKTDFPKLESLESSLVVVFNQLQFILNCCLMAVGYDMFIYLNKLIIITGESLLYWHKFY